MISTLPFNPRITEEHGVAVYYDDNRVYGTVEILENNDIKSISIIEWSSIFPSQGHTTQALMWLRERFDIITAVSVGLVEEFDGEMVADPTILYWEHMRSKGLVDVLIDDNGIEI